MRLNLQHFLQSRIKSSNSSALTGTLPPISTQLSSCCHIAAINAAVLMRQHGKKATEVTFLTHLNHAIAGV
jgi:hypothetical protein